MTWLATSERRCIGCGAPLAALSTGEVCPRCLLLAGIDPPPPPPASSNRRFASFELLEEVARGGMGIVYKARQPDLDRLVAVKMLLGGPFAGNQERRRFQAEAKAIAALQHPGIVAIHEVGEVDGLAFFSMDFVEGRTLAALVAEGPLAPARAARYLQAIAEAVHYAHERGILHRDLKPSNVIIDSNDQPRVTDFGLAKQLNGSHASTTMALTLTGQALGSPSYMPPEQVSAKGADLTPASDVYALGALLYHCLTGRPPFMADSIAATLHQVATLDPVSPRALNPSVPQDLETICLKCLSKGPQARYQTARDFGEDLRRFLTDQPILARPAGRWEKFHRFCRRHPLIAALTGVVALLLILVACISTLAASRLQRANREAREQLYNSLTAQARASRWSGRLGRRFDSLNAIMRAAAIEPSLELRNEAIAAMAWPDMRARQAFDFPDEKSAVFDNRLKQFVRFHPDGESTVQEIGVEQPVLRLPDATPRIIQAVWSPSDRYFVAAYGVSNFHFWVYDTQKRQTTLQRSNTWLRSAHFSPRETELAVVQQVAGRHKQQETDIAIYDLETGEVLRAWPGGPLPYAVRFDTSGDRLAVSSTVSSSVRIVDAKTGALLHSLSHPSGVHGIEWRPKGNLLATACLDNEVYLWDLSGFEPRASRLNHGAIPIKLSFHPQGDLIFTAGWDNQMRLWDIRSGLELLRAPAWGAPEFSADGSKVVTTPTLRRMEICEFSAAPECREFPLPSGARGASHCSFSPDGLWLVSSHRDGARIWDVTAGVEIGSIAEMDMRSAAFDAGGTRLFTSSKEGLNYWRLADQTPEAAASRLLRRELHLFVGERAERASLDDKGERIALVRNGWLHVSDTRSGQPLLSAKRQEVTDQKFFGAALSPDGQWCLAHDYLSKEVFLWNLNEQSPATRLPFASGYCPQFTPDNTLLITGSGDDYTGWEMKNWKRRWTFARHNSGNHHPKLAISRDGTTAAAALTAHNVRLFDPRTGAEIATIEAPQEDEIAWLSFSFDGSQLAVAGAKTLRLWDLRTIRTQLASMNLDWNAASLPERGKKGTNISSIRVQRIPQPLRNPNCTSRQIDLSPYYNNGLTNETGPEGSLAGFPVGYQTLGGTVFDIRGIVRLAAKGFPMEVRGIPVDQKCKSLSFLHAANFTLHGRGLHIGDYIIHWKDSRSETVPLINDRNIADWWTFPKQPYPLDTNTTAIAWLGESNLSRQHGAKVQAYRFRWTNPRPEIPIASFDFRAATNVYVPCLLAVTAE